MKLHQSGKGCKYSRLAAGGICGSKQFSLSKSSTVLVLKFVNGNAPGGLGSGSDWGEDEDDDDDDEDDDNVQC